MNAELSELFVLVKMMEFNVVDSRYIWWELKRNIIIHIIKPAAASGRGFTTRRWTRRKTALIPVGSFITAAPRLAAQHFHVSGNNVGGVTLNPCLISPLTRFQPSLDINRPAFLQVFPGNLR